MRLLIAGGTAYIGRHVTQAALAAGHSVTLFNRGRTNPSLFPEVRRLVGDRDSGELDALADGAWDGVIDLSGFVPDGVRALSTALGDRVGHYTFMSSIAVYGNAREPGRDETSALLAWDPGMPQVVTMDSYGPLKVGCERVLAELRPGAWTALRSGFVLGAYGSDLAPWGEAVAFGRPIEVAARAEQPLQYVDVRDLADFAVHATVEGCVGAFNVMGASLSVREFVTRWASVAEPPVAVRWGAANDPLELPADGSEDGNFGLRNDRALEAGLGLRSLEDTARAYASWIAAGGTPPPPPHDTLT